MRSLPLVLMVVVGSAAVASCGARAASSGVGTTDAEGPSDATSDAFTDGSLRDALAERSLQDGFADASPTESDAASYFGGIALFNTGCFPRPLPTDPSTGTSKCRLLLAGVMAGCAQPGLQPASSGDLTAYNNWVNVGVNEYGVQPPQGALCSVDQIVSPIGASCANDTAPGWCYVLGSCEADAGVTCKQDLCTSEGFTGEHLAYASTVLACN